MILPVSGGVLDVDMVVSETAAGANELSVGVEIQMNVFYSVENKTLVIIAMAMLERIFAIRNFANRKSTKQQRDRGR